MASLSENIKREKKTLGDGEIPLIFLLSAKVVAASQTSSLPEVRIP